MQKARSLSLLLSFLVLHFILTGMSAKPAQEKAPRIGSAAFTTDGEHVLLPLEIDGKSSIYRLKKDGAQITRLTFSDSWDSYPVSSPDGTKIVFSRSVLPKRGSESHLYMMNADGSNITPLAKGPHRDSDPVFSPDGKIIYFLRALRFGSRSGWVPDYWHDFDIYAIDVGGSNASAITHQKRYFAFPRPFISHNGEYLLTSFSVDQSSLSSPLGIWKISLEHPSQIQPINPDVTDYLPPYSSKPYLDKVSDYKVFSNPMLLPDGRSLLFTWGKYDQILQRGIDELFKMDLETSKVTQLSDLKLNMQDLSL